MTLTDFLLARIAEDERAARAVPPAFNQREPFSLRFSSWESDHSAEDSEFVERFNPARVLAECEAKRQIVGERLFPDRDPDYDLTILGARILGALALPYADHPDFQEEWRP